MKRTIYITLLLLYTTMVHAYMYQNSTHTYQPQTRIGYTTNYSNGQFTPSTYQNLNTSTYSGTYNPYSNGNTNNGGSGRPGQPRRVKGYTADGDSINPTGNAGNPNPMWEDGYDYYYWNGHWYRKSGNSWGEWRTLFDWGLVLWDWRSGKPGTNNPTQYYKYPPTPIGDAITPLLILMFAYLSCQQIKKRR